MGWFASSIGQNTTNFVLPLSMDYEVEWPHGLDPIIKKYLMEQVSLNVSLLCVWAYYDVWQTSYY